ncbi:hypothetical protein DL765_010767 [Monosporascus sp. GIB2]|nr:hypothetical protein DL765_010767 [Monosporascus sp. GIB2]
MTSSPPTPRRTSSAPIEEHVLCQKTGGDAPSGCRSLSVPQIRAASGVSHPWSKCRRRSTRARNPDRTWDIRPDCAYRPSLEGFNWRHRFQIRNCAFVRDSILCPYFAVKFRRGDGPEEVALYQVRAAGSLALYNRFHLCPEAYKARRNLRKSGSIYVNPNSGIDNSAGTNRSAYGALHMPPRMSCSTYATTALPLSVQIRFLDHPAGYRQASSKYWRS